MTRDQRIRAALAALECRDDECRRRVERALTAVDVITGEAVAIEKLGSKENKLKVKALRNALARVRVTYNALPKDVLPVNLSNLDLKKHVAACDDYIRLPTNATKPTALKQRQAAAIALHLLHQYGKPILASHRSKWCRLAAILYGKPNAHLLPYCREMLKFRRKKK